MPALHFPRKWSKMVGEASKGAHDDGYQEAGDDGLFGLRGAGGPCAGHRPGDTLPFHLQLRGRAGGRLRGALRPADPGSGAGAEGRQQRGEREGLPAQGVRRLPARRRGAALRDVGHRRPGPAHEALLLSRPGEAGAVQAGLHRQPVQPQPGQRRRPDAAGHGHRQGGGHGRALRPVQRGLPPGLPRRHPGAA